MYILRTIAHETLWGGSKLGLYLNSSKEKIGHLYFANGHKNISNQIVNGKYKGKSLREVFSEEKGNWNMQEYDEFPLTIALVDAREKLSIQVHPDDEVAKKLEKKKIGKSESWIFLEPPTNGWIFGGCVFDSKEELQKAIRNGKTEDCASRMKIKKSDYVFIEAGTLHAMTNGSLVYEIEYGSDYTYRIYDYNRTDETGCKRELQVDKAIEAIHYQAIPKGIPIVEGEWISEKKYEVCFLNGVSDYENKGKELECLTIIESNTSNQKDFSWSGVCVLLLPGEIIEGVNIVKGIVARLRHKDA